MSPERPVRGEARRALILDAALEVIAGEGPGALTHRRVAAAAGLPLAATTYWFSSKDELLTAAYRLAADRDIRRVTEFADRHAGTSDLAEVLTELLAAELGEGRTALIASFAMWLEATRRPELRSIEHDWTEGYLSAVAGLLEGAGSPSPRLDAQVLTAAIDGLLLGHLARGAQDDVRTAIRPVLARLVEGLVGDA
ncbi:TetR/AcrR family transcriptional regulator [Paraconexibacter sp.]|uniref:TetR/AcrR family transcriptional regulator n=1 Tax=Paraconexibacter sp. TaxID=2949640 RepID=UPI00356AF34B